VVFEDNKKPAGVRRVLKGKVEVVTFRYPFSGRAASVAEDQRHHQACAERT
jgi:hypothetical protein